MEVEGLGPLGVAEHFTDTTSRYVHHDITELGAEHRRIDRLRTDPLARHQENRRRQADGRAR